MVVNTKISVKNKKLYEKLNLITNKSIFKILESTQFEPLTIDEVVKEVKITKSKVEFYLSRLHKMKLIKKSKKGKYVQIKSNVDFNKLSKIL